MSEVPKKHARFQMHLSTAIVLMFVAGVLIRLNVQRWADPTLPMFLSMEIPLFGWPFYTRYSILTLDNEEAAMEPLNGYLHWPHIFADAAIGLSILALVFFIFEWWIIRNRPCVSSN